jgi:hypothetical protein
MNHFSDLGNVPIAIRKDDASDVIDSEGDACLRFFRSLYFVYLDDHGSEMPRFLSFMLSSFQSRFREQEPVAWRLGLPDHRLHCVQDATMKLSIACDHTAVVAEPSPRGEVKGPAVNIRHPPTRLFDND